MKNSALALVAATTLVACASDIQFYDPLYPPNHPLKPDCPIWNIRETRQVIGEHWSIRLPIDWNVTRVDGEWSGARKIEMRAQSTVDFGDFKLTAEIASAPTKLTINDVCSQVRDSSTHEVTVMKFATVPVGGYPGCSSSAYVKPEMWVMAWATVHNERVYMLRFFGDISEVVHFAPSCNDIAATLKIDP